MNLTYISITVTTLIVIILSIISITMKNKTCSSDSCNCNYTPSHTTDNTIPIGAITIWSGHVTNIPNNWYLCDGTNGTPDLRGKFVIGENDTQPNQAGNVSKIGNTPLSLRVLGSEGGEETHTLTLDEMPGHSHNIINVHIAGNLAGYSGGGTSFSQATSPPQTNPTGGDMPHNNMPPYYVLAYIMKYQ